MFCAARCLLCISLFSLKRCIHQFHSLPLYYIFTFLMSCLFFMQVSGPVSVSEGHEMGMCWAWSLPYAHLCCQEPALWGCDRNQTAARGPKADCKDFTRTLLTPWKLMGLLHLNQPSAVQQPILAEQWWVCAEIWHSITLQQHTKSDLCKTLTEESGDWLSLQLQPGFTRTFNPVQEHSGNLATESKNILVREVEPNPV